MQFKNPVNGHIVSKTSPAGLVLLFGGFYFLISGIWIHAVAWLIIAMGSFGILGGGGFLVVLVMSIIYAIKAESIVRGHYLARGWTEVDDGGTAVQSAGQTTLRKCPFCAEEIQAAAVKCKHCGSAVEPIKPTIPELPLYERRQRLLADHGVVQEGDGFRWNGNYFGSFAEIEAAVSKQVTPS